MNPATGSRSVPAAASSRSGSALVVALWIVMLLTLIVSSFAFDMFIESRITTYYRKRVRAGYLAQAGIERARLLLVKSGDPNILKEDFEKKDAPWYVPACNLARGSAIQAFTDTLPTGTVLVDIVPEVARRNVNTLSKEDWDRVLKSAGVPEDLWDELTDCVFDWVDGDSAMRPRGAESDYYGQLDPPYSAKNGPLYTVDELLLVKGFEPAFLYGGARQGGGEDDPALPGMADLLTTFGEGRVNVNAASARVLMTLPGVDERIAGWIVQERELEKETGAGTGGQVSTQTALFESPEDFFNRMSRYDGGLRSRLQNLITTSSGTYRITSTGRSQGVERQVSCVANVDTRTGAMVVLRWLETEGQ